MKISEIHSNPNNPRLIKDDRFKKLVKSISSFPKMMELRPIIIDNEGMILGGNMRFKAIKELKYKDIPDTWIKRAEELTDAEKQEFIVKDNVGFGDWDFNSLENWDKDQLVDWGMELPENNSIAGNKLIDRFVIPPFSILDTRQGYWQDRKKYWKELINDNGESREELLGSGGITLDNNSNSWLHNPKKGGGVSILDPVLSEIINLWFGLMNCKTFDPFSGDSVFGYVSSYLGNEFTGIELRKEQVDLNNERIKGFDSRYICDDGQNILNHIQQNSQDLLFSCPPYFNLEKYSDKINDASNQKEYKSFIEILNNAFTYSIKCLKENRFAVIVVGDIRDKDGFYHGITGDVKDIFKNNGLKLYNELILIEVIAFGAIRAGGNMDSRKITKCHQNVLVFYKGNVKKIKEIFSKLDFNGCENME